MAGGVRGSFSLARATHRHGLPVRALIMRHSSIGIEFLSYFGSLVRFWIESTGQELCWSWWGNGAFNRMHSKF